MKPTKPLISLALAAMVAFAVANDASSSFDKLKSLAGTWTGSGLVGKSKASVKVIYRVVSGGNAVEEEIEPGTPHDMITIFYMDGKSLVMTHYCDMGNQPHMKLTEGSGPETLSFDFEGGSNIPPGAGHMHSLSIHVLGSDHIENKWTAYQNDKPLFTVDMDLHREKGVDGPRTRERL